MLYSMQAFVDEHNKMCRRSGSDSESDKVSFRIIFLVGRSFANE